MKTSVLFVCASLMGFAASVAAQQDEELLLGGNMEDESAWTTIQLDKPDLPDYQFNFTDDTPTEGQGGCLRVSATVTQEADVFFYQEVTLIAGEEYTVAGAFRDLGENVFQFWASLCYVLEEPVEGAPLTENTLIGFNTWNEPAAGLDGTFQDDFSAGPGPTFTLPDSLGDDNGLVTIYFGINIGSYTGGTSVYEFNVLVDEMSIVGPKPATSGVANRDSEVKGFNLHQNYPNPFNPQTTISYSLPKAGNVTLIVLDPTGREVARLVNNEKRAGGTHQVAFNAASLPSGVYLYRLKTESATETKKMLLVK